ncbi:MAG: hypothetical protein J6386_03745 [Candidatus Synoicihabitans palmerolidicus]|nr:hypothetical protein [Candidatus Synoicihabitans palmerolidicus]
MSAERFRNRFNRFHCEGGHLFQGRFKSLVVENQVRLGGLCHYIHLNPARAGMCPVGELSSYRAWRMWFLNRPKSRPPFLRPDAYLTQAGGLSDDAAGHRSYLQYLRWLHEDEPTRKDMEFERMCRGWALGSPEFKQELAKEIGRGKIKVKLTQIEARQMREAHWRVVFEQCLRVLKQDRCRAAQEP